MSNEKSVSLGSGEAVLVIEDDRDVRDLIEMMLRHLGYEVFGAEDASSARRALDKHPQIAAILSDVVLPGDKKGPELAEELRSTHPKTKVILMSGYPMDLVKHNAVSGINTKILRKPFKVAELARVTRNALDSKSSVRKRQ